MCVQSKRNYLYVVGRQHLDDLLGAEVCHVGVGLSAHAQNVTLAPGMKNISFQVRLS